MLHSIPAKRIVGIQARCSNQNPGPIMQLWGRFFKLGLSQRFGGEVHGVYFDYEFDHSKEYTLLVGCQVEDDLKLPPDLANDLSEHVIEAGTYESFDASGPRPQAILDGWNRVWTAPLDRAYRTDFEEYLPGDVQTIYIGVR